MSRLLFIKEGVAVWSSHLDLMRALMRSFRRAGIDLKHSQGFTPHPELSILMPLSVGVESQCEIAEFSLAEGCDLPASEIAARMNPVLPAGLRALDSYDGGQKAGKLAWLRARLALEYEGSGIKDQGSGDDGDAARSQCVCSAGNLPAMTAMQNAECRMQNEGSGFKDQGSGDARTSNARPYGAQNDRIEALTVLFARPSLIVEKHSKKGDVEMDIAPMIREIHVGTSIACPPSAPADGQQNEGSGDARTSNARPYGAQNGGGETVVIEAVVAAQNPTLNPLLLVTAIETYLPEYKPDHVVCRRLEIYDADMNVFR